MVSVNCRYQILLPALLKYYRSQEGGVKMDEYDRGGVITMKEYKVICEELRAVIYGCNEKIDALFEELREKDRTIKALNSLRPLWAQGHSDDSIAAQVSYSALAQIFKALEVDNQTDAMKQIATLKAAMKEKDEVIENWKREHNRLIDVDCEKILALNADNEILRNMNKILLDSVTALAAERDGYRNGQAQVQSIADGLMDTIEKYAKERAVLTAENAELTKICLAGEPPYYTKWKEVTAELESSNRKLENVCAVLEKKNSHVDTLAAKNNDLTGRLEIANEILIYASGLKAENAKYREALESALPRMAHRFECVKVLPSEMWHKNGSMSLDSCRCEIKAAQAALQTEGGGENV
jgi:hypothetical protein